jgi:hypothetical protein
MQANLPMRRRRRGIVDSAALRRNAFSFTEPHLDRIEVGRVLGRIAKRSPGRFNRFRRPTETSYASGETLPPCGLAAQQSICALNVHALMLLCGAKEVGSHYVLSHRKLQSETAPLTVAPMRELIK